MGQFSSANAIPRKGSRAAFSKHSQHPGNIFLLFLKRDLGRRAHIYYNGVKLQMGLICI